MHDDNIKHFDSLGAEYILKEIKIFKGNLNITTNIPRIQASDFCIGFIDFLLKGKTLLGYID